MRGQTDRERDRGGERERDRGGRESTDTYINKQRKLAKPTNFSVALGYDLPFVFGLGILFSCHNSYIIDLTDRRITTNVTVSHQ